jgi:hypothetical protein
MLLIEDSLGTAVGWRELEARNLIETQDHIPTKKPRGYRATEWVLEQWFEISENTPYAEYSRARFVDLFTGKPSVREQKTKKTDDSGTPYPENLKQALEVPTKNGRYFNRTESERCLQRMRRDVTEASLAEESVFEGKGSGSEDFREAKERRQQARNRWRVADTLYRAVLRKRSLRQTQGDICWYQPALQLTPNGRIVERGGFQGAPRELKAASILGIMDVHNYDMEAAHPNGFRQLLKSARIDSSWLDQVLTTRDGDRTYKQIYAERVGLEPEVWKSVFIGVLYGSHLPKKASVPLKATTKRRWGKKKIKQPKVRVELWKAAGGNLETMQTLIDALRQQLAPLLELRRQLYRWITKEYVPKNTRKCPRNGRGREYILNCLGRVKYLDSLPNQTRDWGKKITSFLLMGMEAISKQSLRHIRLRNTDSFLRDSETYCR